MLVRLLTCVFISFCCDVVQSVLNSMTLTNGEVFSLPIVLAIPKACCGETAATNVYWMSSAPSVSNSQGRMMLRDVVSTHADRYMHMHIYIYIYIYMYIYTYMYIWELPVSVQRCIYVHLSFRLNDNLN